MAAIRFNPLTYARKLQNSGLSKESAEVMAQEQAEIISNILSSDIATKQDMHGIKSEMNAIKHEIKLLEQRLTIKLGSIMIAGIAVLGFILKH